MRISTVEKLQEYLDDEFSWRLKEIAHLKATARASESIRQGTVIRAGVPLLYAHWEGFVKNAAKGYLIFVDSQRLAYRDLSANFVVLGAKKHINNLSSSRKTHTNLEVVKFFRNEMGSRAKLRLGSAIETESNLSSGVFQNIAITIGIDPSQYETRHRFIDSELVDQRNHIAHGKYLKLNVDDYRKLADEVIVLLRWFKTDIENAASSNRFRLTVDS